MVLDSQKNTSFSISRMCQPLTRDSLVFLLAQSSTTFPVEVLAGSSSVLGEAGARWSASAFLSVVSERTVEGNFQSRLVASYSLSPVSRGLSLVAGSSKSPEGCSFHGSSTRADSIYRCVLSGVGVGVHLEANWHQECGLQRNMNSTSTSWSSWLFFELYRCFISFCNFHNV